MFTFFFTLSATRVLNSFEELCITLAAADNSFVRELNPHWGAYIVIHRQTVSFYQNSSLWLYIYIYIYIYTELSWRSAGWKLGKFLQDLLGILLMIYRVYWELLHIGTGNSISVFTFGLALWYMLIIFRQYGCFRQCFYISKKKYCFVIYFYLQIALFDFKHH